MAARWTKFGCRCGKVHALKLERDMFAFVPGGVKRKMEKMMILEDVIDKKKCFLNFLKRLNLVLKERFCRWLSLL